MRHSEISNNANFVDEKSINCDFEGKKSQNL